MHQCCMSALSAQESVFLACTGIALVDIKCVQAEPSLQVSAAAHWQCQSSAKDLGRSQLVFL